MKHLQIEKIRSTPGASLLLFITDRCPVGCAHCSVDSRTDSPTISDFKLFRQLLDGIAAQAGLQVVGISGGEPFAERRGLTLACDWLQAEGKAIVVYTSGVWAVGNHAPAWISRVLSQCATVYLSTDSFHQENASRQHFIRAARQIVEAGAWIVVQTLEVQEAASLLREAFGENFQQHAELVEIWPLRNGRGHTVFPVRPGKPASYMGTCSLALTPVVRYDGRTSSCCNEDIIMSHGPARFRRQVRNQQDLQDVLRIYRDDPLMRCIAGAGLGNLVEHPELAHLAKENFMDNCDLCWKIAGRFPALPATDPLLAAIADLGEVS